MNALPITQHPLVIRTDYDGQHVWERICELIRAPVRNGGDTFYAQVDFLDAGELRNLLEEDLLARVPADYPHSFLFVVDQLAIRHQDFPILVIDLHYERGRAFRAVPSQIQGIENNLSIANMSFFEFADNVDTDGVFRGFPD
jgi:hypothetical protein